MILCSLLPACREPADSAAAKAPSLAARPAASGTRQARVDPGDRDGLPPALRSLPTAAGARDGVAPPDAAKVIPGLQVSAPCRSFIHPSSVWPRREGGGAASRSHKLGWREEVLARAHPHFAPATPARCPTPDKLAEAETRETDATFLSPSLASSKNSTLLQSPGLGSPLPVYDQLMPSTRAQPTPWTEVIVFPAASDRDRHHNNNNVARARSRCLPPVIAARSPTPPYSEDGNSSDSESGECTTPTSDESSFASSLHKAPINAAAPSMMPPIPTINVFPVPSRRASAPSVARAAKINPTPVVRVLAPPVDLVRRRTASPTLSQISAHVVLTSSSRPLRRAASIPPAAATTATRSAASGESRLPLFLLARRQAAAEAAASKEQQAPQLGPASPAGVSIPTFTVTPPPERADSGRRLKEILANRM
jgi:hypothetical protein